MHGDDRSLADTSSGGVTSRHTSTLDSMRVKELADLTGTTVRTIRHYHQIGLLEVPDIRFSYRDYDLSHVARMTRIRWLSQAGIDLSSIASILEAEVEATDLRGVSGDAHVAKTVLDDLNAAVGELDRQVDRLRDQRERLCQLVASVEAGGALSPMPASMVRFYDTMERRCTDDSCRRTVRRERDFNEVAFYRGDMPVEVGLMFEGLDEPQLAESADAFRDLARSADGAEPPSDDDIDTIAAAVVARIKNRMGSKFTRVANDIDLDMVRRAVNLYVEVAPARERRLAGAVGEAILRAVSEGGQS